MREVSMRAMTEGGEPRKGRAEGRQRGRALEDVWYAEERRTGDVLRSLAMANSSKSSSVTSSAGGRL